MNQLVPYLIKSTSILLILFVYYKLFLRKQTFFRLNRLYLLSTLLIAITAPFISIEIQSPVFTPEIHPIRIYMSNLLDEVYVFANHSVDELTEQDKRFNYLSWGYFLGVSIFMVRYLISLLQIERLKHRYPVKHYHGVNIYLLPENKPSFSYFNNLFIFPNLPREDRRKIFEHEKIHIRQWHSIDLLIAEVICITNWFNPLVWILKNSIMENHEYIADRQVIRRYHTGSYLELLIRQTLQGAFSFSNYFSCSNLKKRTIMMTKKQSRKYWVLSFIPVTALLVTLLYGFSCNKMSTPVPAPDLSFLPQPILTPGQIPDSIQQNTKEKDLFVVVEEMPVFSEGNVQQWISRNIRYPADAVKNKIEGKVFIQFIIEKDGSITNVKVSRGVNASLDNEAVRVIKAMPKWKPGKQKGKPVRVSFTLPIHFSVHSSPVQTPDEKYTRYIRDLEKMEQKIKNPSLLTANDKAPIGKRMFGNETNDKKAYEKQLEWVSVAASPSMIHIRQLMDSLRFSDKEKNTVIGIYDKYIQANLKLVRSIGPDNFIQKFSEIPSFEYAKLLLQAQLDLKNSLSPEHHKQFVLGSYLKSQSPNTDIFTAVEDMPDFPEGPVQKWIAQNLKYPDSAKQQGIEGKVYIQFIIDQDGNVTAPKILRGVSPELDQEAIRLVNSMPKWKPGRQKGQAVKVSYTLPIHFKLH